ncbi:MAG: DegT/DnrJ/EryC1/StrS family aminotransferase [Rhizobacter sp.]|nr:DegT/DnrJ/EryC1/StrS family aminotransferase [Rhizobacter sp.]
MIPLFSASAVNAHLDLAPVLQRVLDSHWYVLGKEVRAFEEEFARYVSATDCVSLANGTDALELALRAVGVEAGSQVACVANAGFYGSTAIRTIGAVPRYVEIDPRTLCMSPDALRQEAARGGLSAVIVTHLYGQLADIEALRDVAQDAGSPLIEDCAQSHGARRDGKLAGSFGHVACFSFYPTKNLGALGDGGAITTSRPDLADAVRTMRQYGWSTKYHVDHRYGGNSRLDEMQAAVLRYKLPGLDAANALRREIATAYQRGLAHLPDLVLPASIDEDHVAHLYVVRTAARDALREHLSASGVGSDIHYPVPDHRQAAWQPLEHPVSLPVTDEACQQGLTLPCFPGLATADVERVIQAVRDFHKA